jgi:Flp pilus assembly protein TadD
LIDKGEVEPALQHCAAAVRLEAGNSRAQNALGAILLRKGEFAQAAGHFREAIRLEPGLAHAHHNLALVLLQEGDLGGAAGRLQEAVRLHPRYGQAHERLAGILLQQGQYEEAAGHFREALRFVAPGGRAGSLGGLGQALQALGHSREAAACFREAEALRPDDAAYHRGLAFALRQEGRVEESRAEYREALRLDPRWLSDATRAAWRLATHPDPRLRNGQQALLLSQQLAQATDEQDGRVLDTLVAAHAESRKFPEAVAYARKARERAAAAAQPGLAREIEDRLRRYEKGQPYRAMAP